MCFTLITVSLSAKNLVFDLGLTLIEPSKISVGSHLGFADTASFWLKYGSASTKLISQTLIDVLNHNEANGSRSPAFKKPRLKPTTLTNITAILEEDPLKFIPCDPLGNPMPPLMCEWLKGTETCTNTLQKSLAKVDQFPHYKSKQHKDIIHRLVSWLFTPRSHAESMSVIPSAQRILRELARARDHNGKPKHQLYILSNMDPESFEIMRTSKHLRSVFKYFNPHHIVVSGIVKDMKPHLSIFKTLIESYNLDPAETILFDDQAENREAAKAIGIVPYELSRDYHKDKHALRKMGLL